MTALLDFVRGLVKQKQKVRKHKCGVWTELDLVEMFPNIPRHGVEDALTYLHRELIRKMGKTGKPQFLYYQHIFETLEKHLGVQFRVPSCNPAKISCQHVTVDKWQTCTFGHLLTATRRRLPNIFVKKIKRGTGDLKRPEQLLCTAYFHWDILQMSPRYAPYADGTPGRARIFWATPLTRGAHRRMEMAF